MNSSHENSALTGKQIQSVCHSSNFPAFKRITWQLKLYITRFGIINMCQLMSNKLSCEIRIMIFVIFFIKLVIQFIAIRTSGSYRWVLCLLCTTLFPFSSFSLQIMTIYFFFALFYCTSCLRNPVPFFV